LGFSEFKSIIDQLTQKKNYIPNLQLAVRGEPFMNRQAGQIISYAKEKGLYVLINTNGLLLNPRLSTALIEAGLDMIIISIDGATKDTYESMRKGGDFDTLLKNIRDLVKQKKGRGARLPFVELQCIVSRKNERELEKMNKLALSLGVDNLRFKSYKVTCFDRDAGSIESLKKDLPDSLKYRRYLIKGGVLQPRSLPRVCSWANDLIVYSNADVGACCEDFDKKYTCGNILRDGLWKVLHSKQRGQLKQKICKRELEICKTCS
jgi:MoaA/NifB/PqqE/SkfB family radical SAM enzyme